MQNCNSQKQMSRHFALLPFAANHQNSNDCLFVSGSSFFFSTSALFKTKLVGSFNPSETYKSNWIISPNRDEHITSLSCHNLEIYMFRLKTLHFSVKGAQCCIDRTHARMFHGRIKAYFLPQKQSKPWKQCIHWNLRYPPKATPPGNKALLRDYWPLVSLN